MQVCRSVHPGSPSSPMYCRHFASLAFFAALTDAANDIADDIFCSYEARFLASCSSSAVSAPMPSTAFPFEASSTYVSFPPAYTR